MKTFIKIQNILIAQIIFLSVIQLHAQDDSNYVDLGIRFSTAPPTEVKINEVFSVQAEVYLDSNTTTVPAGETVTAEVTLVDPDGFIIQSVPQTWSGFNEDTAGTIANESGQLLLQVPWSQASKWSETALWKIVLRLTASSVESDLGDNLAEHSFSIQLPDLGVSISNVTSTDPLTGAETTNFVPNTNYTVSGTVTNTGEVMTQPSVRTAVVAQLRRLVPLTEGQYGLGTVMDEQSIVFPSADDPLLYLPPNASSEFTIGNLFLPADATGSFVVTLEVNPADTVGGRIMMEQSYTNNFRVFPSVPVDENSDGEIDFYQGNIIEVGSGDENATSFPQLEFVPNSYNGEKGTFRGLDPAFISFAIRNNGTRPVAVGDKISSSVLLSKDLEVDESDFVLREFNLGGDGIGFGMLAGETINLTWFQQLPDNFEGDYYLLIEISNHGESQVFPMDSTPLISISSQNAGTTSIVRTAVNNGTFAERPSTSQSGRYVVYEKSVENAGQLKQQIYLMDLQTPDAQPLLISRAFNHGGGGNGNSFRPRISLDGNTIVFHSSSTDLVPGDTNNKEDVFLYRVANNTILRAVNASNQQLNGRSLYADVNGDGTKIVFESDATNADLTKDVSGGEIFLWELSQSSSGTITALTNGNRNSYNPSIDSSGNRIVFDSFASNLLAMEEYDNGSSSIIDSDDNGFRDVFLIDLSSSKIFLASVSYLPEQTLDNASMNPRISGNGERIVFESKATNLIPEAGIASVLIEEGGVGYAGNPTIEIFDEGFNVDGTPGFGSFITLREDGINALSELKKDALIIIDPGTGYVNPKIRIVSDPSFPKPTYEAKAVAYLSNPEGDIYFVEVADLNGTTTAPVFAQRVSQSFKNKAGGNFGSREPSINYDGSKIVYSTKSFNLLPETIERDDGKTFYNSSFRLPTARAILAGPIDEIEILNKGSGYSGGFLIIEDLSGAGSGAQASYEVDQRGSVVSIQVINSGQNYRLDTTRISIAEPLGGSGFIAGKIRFQPTQGLGSNRTGGARIFKVEMQDYGLGYKIGADENASFADLIQFEGDGADLNNDGFPDGRLNPSRIHNVSGSLYLEQKFDVEILSGSDGKVGSDLLNSILTISDKNNSLNPLIIGFSEGAGTSAQNIQITLGLTTKSEVRDALIEKINDYMSITSTGLIKDGLIIENNQTNGSSFTFSALSGLFTSNNPSAIKVVEQSNMLIMGSGYTTVTPVVNQVPSIYGFSEVKNNPDFTIGEGSGRVTLLAQEDDESDDIYLFDVNTSSNTRISTSSFGTPAAYLSNQIGSVPSPPSNRFPSISGNGRYIFFSSDAFGLEGLAFFESNQKPNDSSPVRDIFYRDLKTAVDDSLESSKIHLLYPTDDSISYAPYNPIPVIARFEGLERVDHVDVILNQQRLGEMEEFIAEPPDQNRVQYNTGRYNYNIPRLAPGEYVLQLVAYGESGQVLSTSPLTRLNISAFEGSIPPIVSFSNPGSYNQITSTSTIPFSVTAIDPDGSIENIQFFINGLPFEGPISLPQGLVDDNFIFSKLWSPQESGVFSVHATGIDGSGNVVASSVYHITATTGNTGPKVFFTSPFSSTDLNASDLLNVSVDGEITSLGLPDDLAFGENYYSEPIILISGSGGEGAKISAVIGKNPSNSSEYGKIIKFSILDGGSGYDPSKTNISIVPSIQTVVSGVHARVSHDTEYNNTDPSDFISAQFYIGNDLSGPQVGDGYVVSPRYIVDYPHQGRLPLEDPQPGATTSKVKIFSFTTEEAAEGRTGPILTGGFSHAPVFFEINATSPIGNEIVEVGMMIDSTIIDRDYKYPYSLSWIPDDPGYYNLYSYAIDSFGNFTISEKLTILVKEMVGSNINSSFLSPKTDVFNTGSTAYLSVQATAENGISNVEFFFDGTSIGFGEKSSYSNEYSMFYELSELPEGEYEISYLVRDAKGNQSGVFSSDHTTILSRQSKIIRIVPKGDFLPIVLSPVSENAEISAEWNGTSMNFTVNNGGQGYRFQPDLLIEGGGGSDLSASVSLKHGVIENIDIKSGGNSYVEGIIVKVLENVNYENESNVNALWYEHAGSSRAVLEPVLNEIGSIVEINVVDGGSGYFPEATALKVVIDYNGTISGSGFEAGPIYVKNGVISGVTVDNNGTGYSADATVSINGGGHNYVEGEAVHIRVVADVGSGVEQILLRANGEPQTNRPLKGDEDFNKSGYVDIVANDPYYDLFWVPDRNSERGLGKVDGLGTWTFEVVIVDTKGHEQISQPFEIRVVNSKPPEAIILTPEEGSEFVFDPSGSITLVANAYDEDGVVQYVQFLINNLTTDINGSDSFIVDTDPYIFDWTPDTVGDFNIRAIAVDNGGVSSISKSVKILVKEPIGFKPEVSWEFPYEMKDRDPYSGYSFFYFGGSNSDKYVDEDFEVGSQIPLSVRAADDAGQITQVEFFVDNESIGKVDQRYDGVYTLTWIPTKIGQSISYGEVTDNDGNKVRTDVRTFNIGSNLGKDPTVKLAFIRKSSGLKFEAQVHVTDIIDPVSRWFYPSPEDDEVKGSFSLVLLLNGAPVANIDVDALPLFNDYDVMQPVGDPEFSNTLSYNFTQIEPLEFGTLSFSAVLMSRQGQPSYRQSIVSNTIDIQVSEEQFNRPIVPNLAPQGELLSPQSTQAALATSSLYKGLLPLDPNYGKIQSLSMLEIGGGYNPDDLPQVKILGGGGKGALAKVEIIEDGAIGNFSIIDGGTNYKNGDLITIETNGSGVGFNAFAMVKNGSLESNQTFTSGAILDKGDNYQVNDLVKIFDITTGNGALGFVSKIDDNTDDNEEKGGVEEIFVFNSGQDYNASTTQFFITSAEGEGFKSGYPLIVNGVIDNFAILENGSGYNTEDLNTFMVSSDAGLGFSGTLSEQNIRDGAIKVELLDGGQDYIEAPLVILSGGSYMPGVDGRKKPTQITAGSKVTLLANANDFDGIINSVNFYGNGQNLGIQTRKELISITVTSPGIGYTSAPVVTIDGGGGTKSTAFAILEPAPKDQNGKPDNNTPRGLAQIIVAQRGNGFTSTPTVTIEGGGGFGAKADAIIQDRAFITEAYELVGGSGRWGMEWVPDNPGSYEMELEIIDDDGAVTFRDSGAQIIVLPKSTSKTPEISINTEYHGKSFTSQSRLRFIANAQDIDGKMEGVQFFVDGVPLGEEIKSSYAADQFQQPYSVAFAPPEAGVYTVYAIARDNSSNYVMSDTVTFTATTGAGASPEIRITQPTQAAEGDVKVNSQGKITGISLNQNGFGYVEAPEVAIFGIGKDANFSVNIDTSLNSPTFSQILTPIVVESSGTGYLPESTTVEFVGGFSQLSASGQPAKAEIKRLRKIDGTYFYIIDLLEPGLGYTSKPRIALTNAPPGMIASAEIDTSSGRVTTVTIEEQGTDNTNPYDPIAYFTGGLPYSEVMLNAFAEDPDGYIKEVSFYVNGVLMPEAKGMYQNPDKSFPYQLLWSPESPGIYELYATAEDSDGNLITSSVIRREAVLSKPPVVEFNPRDRAFGFLRPDSLDDAGSIVLEDNDTALLPISTLVFEGYGYHSFPMVEFLGANNEGSGAQGEVILSDGKIVGIKLQKNSSGELISGFGYPKFKKLSGLVEVIAGSDLIKGEGTDFKNEIAVGQPLLLGRDGVPDLMLGEYEVEGFQSLSSLLLMESPELDFESGVYELYSFGTEVIIRGGMDTSAQSIKLEQGQELSLGMRAVDPEGTSIRPKEGFTVFINGEIDTTGSVKVSGSGPFYRVIWSPPDIGFYSLRIMAADVDGARGISQTLEIEVKAGMEPQLKMVSPMNDNLSNTTGSSSSEFAFPSTVVFTFEAKDLDGVIDEVTFFANSIQVGKWPQMDDDIDGNVTAASWREGPSNRYSFSFTPRYAGEYSISASAVDDSGQTNFSQISSVEFISPYREGSLPPISEIRYPMSVYQLDGDEISKPATKDIPSFTSTSVIPIIAKAYDQDGGLDSLNYYADGTWLSAYTGYLQILGAPSPGDSFTISDGAVSVDFQFHNTDSGGNNPVRIPISSKFLIYDSLAQNLKDLLEEKDIDVAVALSHLSELGLDRIEIPNASLLEDILMGLKITIIEEQRTTVLNHILPLIEEFKISAEIIGMNGIYFRHKDPNSVTLSSYPTLSSDTSGMVNTKDFAEGLSRFPSRNAEEYHFTQLWTPPYPGVFTLYSVATDNSGNAVMSTPITVRSTLGSTPPEINITSPISGTQRSVTQVGYHAKARVIKETRSNLYTWWYTGRIAGVEIIDPGAGYIFPPTVEFFGSGYGAMGSADIVEDATHPRFGQINGVRRDDFGYGYYGNTLVEFRGGLGQEAVFLNASATDIDGEIQSVQFIRNGKELYNDLTAPYAMQESLSVGYYEFIAIAKDDAGNMVASPPKRLNISTTQGAAPSAMIINPLPPLGQELAAQGQDYFWDFAREYSKEIQTAESSLENQSENFDVTANSFIHLVSRATDSDGEVEEVSFYLNNKLLGKAERIHDSSHYLMPLDLSDFGEQPSYVIQTVIKDNAGNLIIPNNPLELNVLSSSGARPQIDIIVPDPRAPLPPIYPIGSSIGLAVEAIPDQGTIASVSMYANGRFIAEAEVDENASFGKGAFSLEWTPENPGDYRITASVKDTLGTIIFTKQHVDIIVSNQIGTLPEVELIAPAEDRIITLGSSVRLTSYAMESVGTFDGLQYYVDGQIQYAWNGILDFQGTLPPEGSLIFIDDGTGRDQIVTFEFDGDKVISSGGQHQLIPSQTSIDEELKINGEFTGSSRVTYFIEIDGLKIGRDGSDTFRWSKDGGKTFIDEKVSVLDSINLSGHGLVAEFQKGTGFDLGDRWKILANPKNIIVPLYSEPGAVLRTRNALEEAIEMARTLGVLDIRADSKGSNDKLYLNSTFSVPYENNVTISGSALNTISYINNDFDLDNEADNIIRKESSFGREFYPFGMTWVPKKTGTFGVFAVAKDSTTGSQTVSKSRLVTVVDSAGSLPEITLGLLPNNLVFDAESSFLNLQASAHDPDGKILEVSFYANGNLIELDTVSPYTSSYQIPQSGHYEVYAVALDNDGNEAVSNVESVVVDENMDTFSDALQLDFVEEILRGSVTTLSAIFRSPVGKYGYADDLSVMVFVNDRYAGNAQEYPYERPMLWEEDPGHLFTFDLEARSFEPYEVEFLVVNGNETFSQTRMINVRQNPLSNDSEFLRSFYLGLFDREPEGFEIGRYLLELQHGTITRSQIVEELRCSSEFIKARDNLLIHKTLLGEWRTTQIILADQAVPVGSGAGGASSTNSAGTGGTMGQNADNNRPDDGDNSNTATVIGMNETIYGSINNVDDVDWFRIEGRSMGSDGLLNLEILSQHTGVEVIVEGNGDQKRLEVFGAGSSVPTQFLSPLFARLTGSGRGANSRGTQLSLAYSWDLSSVQETNPNYRFKIFLSPLVDEATLLDRGGQYTMVVRNDAFLQLDGAENSLFENVNSEINNYEPGQALAHMTSKYSYTNEYGEIETHDPESFFNRLFLNKYDQEPNAMQSERGIELLKAGERTQMEFAHQFALENSIITTGGYNYTTSEEQLAIPNVPIDATAFAETALVYSALVGQAPSKSLVAKLTLNPNFDVRPIVERAKLIMEMPAYFEHHGIAIPEVDFIEISNGEQLNSGDTLRVEAVSLGKDRLAGTADDGKVMSVKLFVNGKLFQELRDPDRFFFYEFELDDSIPHGERKIEVLAEGANGFISRAERWVYIGSFDPSISITFPPNGTTLKWGEKVEFNYASDESLSGTSYLEINGNIRWAGYLSLDENFILDENLDGKTFQIQDGTGRDPVTFEFDYDGTLSSTKIDPVEEIFLSEESVGTLTSAGVFRGQSAREYFIEIDGESFGTNKNNTFRWSIDGGANFNDYEIELIKDQNYSLSSGVTLSFDSADTFHVGDRWRIRSYPENEVVIVDSLGTYDQRVDSLKENIIRSINIARNDGRLAIFATDPANRVSALDWPVSVRAESSILLRHDGSYPIEESISIDPNSTSLKTELMFPLTSATDGNLMNFQDWNNLESCDGLLEVRIVHINESGHKAYSNRRAFPVADPSRGYAELISPIGNVYQPGRLPTFYFNEEFKAGDSLEEAQIEFTDKGQGYRWFDDDSKQITIVSRRGSGGVLNADINSSTQQIDSVKTVRSGQGYTAADVLLPSPPVFFDKGEAIELNARLHDPFGEYDRLAFYLNGIEIDANVSDRTSGIYGAKFYSTIPGDGFITARALYGDARDLGPNCPEPFGYYPCQTNYYGGKDHWGWKKSWTQQHYASGKELLPTWFNQLSSYWLKSETWHREAMWDGATPLRIGETDVYASVRVVVDQNSPAVRLSQLFHEQSTYLDAYVEWQKGKEPLISQALLFGNDVLLSEWNASSGLKLQEDQNQSNQDEQSLLPENQLKFTFPWIVDYRDFKDEEGDVDLMVVAISDMGRQFTSNIESQSIRPLSLTDIKSLAPSLYKDLTNKNPTEQVIENILNQIDKNTTLEELVGDLTITYKKDQIGYFADIIGAHKVIFGTDYQNSEYFVDDMGETEENVKVYLQNPSSFVMDYILEKLNGDDYYDDYGFFPTIFGTTEGANLRNRDAIAARHFKNKFGIAPSALQRTQGSKKIWIYHDTNGMIGLDAVAYYIYNLVKEPTVDVGVGELSQPYIAFMGSTSDDYINMGIQFSTEIGLEIPPYDDGTSGEDRVGELASSDSGYRRLISAIVQNPAMNQKFNLLWEDSINHEKYKQWKHEPWFGYFMDEKFPWIYHTDLGWLYSSSTSQKNVWLYSESFGWFWTNRDTFRFHPNLKKDNQRFIFRVRPVEAGGSEGSWCLLTLPEKDSVDSTIYLYDYGYSPF